VRSQLFAAGLLTFATGLVFYVLEVPLVYFWSIPFAIVGGMMAVAAPFMSESHGPVEPPEGYRFCPYCSTIVPIGQKNCGHCGGAQPLEGAG